MVKLEESLGEVEVERALAIAEFIDRTLLFDDPLPKIYEPAFSLHNLDVQREDALHQIFLKPQLL